MKDLSLNFSTHVPPNFDSYRNFRNVWLRNPGGGQNWPNVRQSSRSVVDWSRVCYTFKKFKNRNTHTFYTRSYLHNNNPKPKVNINIGNKRRLSNYVYKFARILKTRLFLRRMLKYWKRRNFSKKSLVNIAVFLGTIFTHFLIYNLNK